MMDVLSGYRDYFISTIVAAITNAVKKDSMADDHGEGSPVSIHPSSALFNGNPEWLVYHVPHTLAAGI